MNQSPFNRKASGKYRSQTLSPDKSPSMRNINVKPDLENNNFLNQLKSEWQKSNLSTEALDRVQSVLQFLQSEKGKKHAENFRKGIIKYMNKLPIKEVVNIMSNDKNPADILKSLGENGNTSDLLKSMMNNPEMQKTAMDMMQEMMGDEKKLAEMTELMQKMLNPENK